MKGLTTRPRSISKGSSVRREGAGGGKGTQELSPSSQSAERGDDDERFQNEGTLRGSFEKKGAAAMDGLSERIQYMRMAKRGDEDSRESYNLWRQEQNNIAARLEKQLQATWEMEQLIEEHLNHYGSQYNCAMPPTTLKDVSDILMPKWLPPQELTVSTWFGDWRPSSILDLLLGIAAHSSISLPDSSERLLSQVVQETRIEETVIESELAEIQATCIVHLPFPPLNNVQSRADALSCVQEQFQKIERVISRAHRLRLKVLELVVKKILNPTDAAEFLVAFTGLQDAIHQYGEQQRSRKTQPMVPVPSKASGSS